MLLQVFQRPKYKTVAVNFDGTNDYGDLGGDLTGAADGDELTFVFSVDFTGGDGNNIKFLVGSGKIFVSKEGAGINKINISLSNAASTVLTDLTSTTTYTSSDGWKTFLFSKSGTTLHLYEKDTNVADTPATNSAGDIDITPGGWSITTTGQLLEANVADLWFDASYIDFSVEANRRKFVDSNGRPVYKGTDGSLPTGTAPLIFLRRGIGDTADSFLTNKGTGGGFTVNGALSASTNGNPTD